MTSKASVGNFFEDFEIGQTFRHSGARTITEGDNALYVGLTGDRFRLYCDGEFARGLGYKRELINDLLVFHVVFGKSVSDISYNAVANLGYGEVRFLEPVYPGDTLHVESRVVGKKENRSGENGNVYVYTRGLNQRGRVVLQFYRWVMVRKRDPETGSGERTIPEIPKEVPAEKLGVDEGVKIGAVEHSGRWYFEDYEAGEEIQHGAGMTLEEAEHATAARLYQNTAQVHFDGEMMKTTPAGRRLVYGGHVISLARALSYNGLENALRILAWNAGTHANPTFAGDTLYAQTRVLEKIALPDRADAGALRLQLVAVKNQNPAIESIQLKSYDEKKNRDVYHPKVVLDLDYVVLMPKKGAPA